MGRSAALPLLRPPSSQTPRPDERYPLAWQTFGQMLLRDTSGIARFPLPHFTRLESPEAELRTELTETGLTVLPAMDPRIDSQLADTLAQVVAGESAGLVVPSLKHISRNPERLFHVVEVVLSNDGVIKTANVMLKPGVIVWRGGGAVHYNEFDLGWVSDHVLRQTGRNDPCPYGSGKKFKRCHGA